MKTKNDKLKFIMEAAGECWHEDVYISSVNKHLYPETNYPRETRYGESICKHCKAPTPNRNPSPDDIGKLMELARNLGYNSVLLDAGMAEGQTLCQIIKFKEPDCDSFEQVEVFAMSDAEALLTALFVAKGGLEDESK